MNRRLQGPKEMSDSMADAALWNFLAESERRRERPPIRAAENTAKDVHHNGQAVAFMSARSRSEPSGRSAPPATMSSGLVVARPSLSDGPALGIGSPRDAPFRFFRRRQRRWPCQSRWAALPCRGNRWQWG